MRAELRYLILLSMFTAATIFVGCDTNRPLIPVKDGVSVESLIKEPYDILAVGEFGAQAPEHKKYADFLRAYLEQRLNERAPPKAINGSAIELLILGNLRILTDVKGADANRALVRIETTFEIADKATGYVIRSIMLAKEADREQASIQTRLRELVDRFVGRLYREEKVINCPMVPGRSHFDRSGREWAQRGNYEKALESFRQAIDTKPNDHAALYNAGLICEVSGQYERAQGYYLRAKGLAKRSDYTIACERIKRKISGN